MSRRIYRFEITEESESFQKSEACRAWDPAFDRVVFVRRFPLTTKNSNPEKFVEAVRGFPGDGVDVFSEGDYLYVYSPNVNDLPAVVEALRQRGVLPFEKMQQVESSAPLLPTRAVPTSQPTNEYARHSLPPLEYIRATPLQLPERVPEPCRSKKPLLAGIFIGALALTAFLYLLWLRQPPLQTSLKYHPHHEVLPPPPDTNTHPDTIKPSDKTEPEIDRKLDNRSRSNDDVTRQADRRTTDAGIPTDTNTGSSPRRRPLESATASSTTSDADLQPPPQLNPPPDAPTQPRQPPGNVLQPSPDVADSRPEQRRPEADYPPPERVPISPNPINIPPSNPPLTVRNIPREGTLVWWGEVQKNQQIRISRAGASSGTVAGDGFPGVPINITLNSKAFSVVTTPNPLNQFSDVVLLSTMKGRVALTIHWTVLPY